MHDPMTVAFEIRYPWRKHKAWPRGVDKWEQLTPEQQRGRRPVLRSGYRESFITIWHVDPEKGGGDNSCDWHGSRTPGRWLHARWHVWHWKIQVHPIQDLKRWLFSRCAVCGKRFPFRAAPISFGGWGSRGPRWFRAEQCLRHDHCPPPKPRRHP